jgi:excisionase family DNA binding protein
MEQGNTKLRELREKVSRKKKIEDRIYPEIMTIEQTAEYLQLGVKTIRRMIEDGELKAAKIRNSWRIRKSDVDDYFNQSLNK